jgi:DNA-binding PadR family transcriptional regulator
VPRTATNIDRLLPLKPNTYLVLLALAEGDRHGYGVMKDVLRLTAERVRLRPGPLYRTIDKCLEDGLIAPSERRPEPAFDDERRVYYRLTKLGREAVRAETDRLSSLIADVERLGLVAPRGRR